MDTLINTLDTQCIKKITRQSIHCINKFNFHISVYLNNIRNGQDLFNAVCSHPDLTEDMIANIIIRNRKCIYVHTCRFITQEFCEKYKSEFILSISEMIHNKLPIKYIIDTHGPKLNTQNRYNIATYCTISEYNTYLLCHNIPPSFNNPCMTFDLYLEHMNKTDRKLDWQGCAIHRPDWFTPDVIIKYKAKISDTDNIWKYYFKQFPVSFIAQNLQYTYSEPSCCIDTFKQHPGNINWNIIDNYLSMRIILIDRYSGALKLSDTINDLPCWFVKKYIHCIKLTPHHMNTHLNYKFIITHIDSLNIKHTDIIKFREQYIIMLHEIISVCNEFNIIYDLQHIILSYC